VICCWFSTVCMLFWCTHDHSSGYTTVRSRFARVCTSRAFAWATWQSMRAPCFVMLVAAGAIYVCALRCVLWRGVLARKSSISQNAGTRCMCRVVQLRSMLPARSV
jgi:hypothetical protein